MIVSRIGGPSTITSSAGHHRFHCVYWPATLLSAASNHRAVGASVDGCSSLARRCRRHQATSSIRSICSTSSVSTVSLLRPVRNAYGADGDFTYEGLVARYNADLANNLGNLLSRVATVVDKKCGGIGPAPSPTSPLAVAATSAYEQTAAAWATVQPSRALEATWTLIRATNAYLETNEPWKSEPGPAVDAVMGDALEALRIVAVLGTPAMPDTSQRVWERIVCRAHCRRATPAISGRGGYPGSRGDQGAPLFPAGRRVAVEWIDSHCHLDTIVCRRRRRRGAAAALLESSRRRRCGSKCPLYRYRGRYDNVWGRSACTRMMPRKA